MRFLLCGINAKYIHSNLAIFSLKAYADRKKIPGAEIILKEYTINNYVEDILQDLYEAKADIIIFSCYIWNISFVRELAAELKKVSPEVKIWAGGPEVSYAANKFLMENPAFDLIMQGEGEEVFSGKRDEVPAGFHVLCGDTGDGKSAAQSQIHRKVSGGSGGELPSGSDHIRHSGRAGVIVDQ